MKNTEIANIFHDIADLLELKGENYFKIRAYQRAIRSIEHLPVELEQLSKEGRLREVIGVGEALEKKITELLDTGRLQYYEDLRAEFPAELSTLLAVPGIGPKTAKRLYHELGVKSVEDLESAIVEGKMAGLFRMGDKTADNIMHHLQSMHDMEKRTPIGLVLPLVEDIMSSLRQRSNLRNLIPAGSLRRFQETIGDIDLMGTAADGKAVVDAFIRLPQVKEILAKGDTRASVISHQNIQVDFRVVEDDAFGSLLQYFTGSKQHNIDLREKGHQQGLKLSEYGITDLQSGVMDKFATEEDFYHRLGLQFIPPELRVGQQELERAEKGTIPDLVNLTDIKGDLHVHTDWSDGHDSIETMAIAARATGYEYIAITDHSKGRGIAHGLNEERVKEQVLEIRRLNERLEGIRILTGIEVDICADGSLDFPDELLKELDVVIAGVHSAMGQEEGRMTQRVLSAIESPYVDIIAHPTCRLLGEREPVAVDMEAIFCAAARTGTILEINAMPKRLDLKDIHIFRARDLGVKLVIGTDAHSTEHFTFVRFGVGIARRGWCEAGHILNTLPLQEVIAYLKHYS